MISALLLARRFSTKVHSETDFVVCQFAFHLTGGEARRSPQLRHAS